MSYPDISSSTFLKKMLKEMGDDAFTHFAKKVSVICEEIEKRKKEEAAHRQKQLEKLNPILELLREDKFSFDESQLTEYLLSRADSKTSLHPQEDNTKNSTAKYQYRDENDRVQTWSGRGRIPGALMKQITGEQGQTVNYSGMTKTEKEKFLAPFLIVPKTENV